MRRRAKREAKRGAGRTQKRPPFRKMVLALDGGPRAGFRVDLLRAHPGDELVYIQNSGLVVTDLQGTHLASEPFRGDEGGGDALRVKGFVYHQKGVPAVVSVWNWCTETEDGAMKCLNYEDTCWESQGALECSGAPR